MILVDALVAVAIAIGLVGIVVPVLPGSLLILAALVAWGVASGGTTAWVVVALAGLLLVAGGVVKYVVPGRRLKEAGVPASTQWVGAALGVVGFFVVPVVGVVLGFVLGVYLAELRRVGSGAAWSSTMRALRAVGLGMAIEIAAALGATVIWLVGAVVT